MRKYYKHKLENSIGSRLSYGSTSRYDPFKTRKRLKKIYDKIFKLKFR